MQELISPQQSEKLVIIVSLMLLVIGIWYGGRVAGPRGRIAGITGPLVYGLWQAHKYVTRYDPQTHYFGLESLAVLVGEVLVFVILGAALGRAWERITRDAQRAGAGQDT